MTAPGNTLHFINRVDNTNCGDSMVSPLIYYYDYFKQYQIKRHDQRFIDFDSISSSDVVIIGGGGLFDYAEFTNRLINRVLDTGAAVISWSPGINTHDGQENTVNTKIEFDRFALATLRDYENKYGVAFLPDVTCNLPGLKKHYTIRRKYGIARHKDYPIEGLDFESITNDRDIEEILQFLGESEVVISNSFHMIYWSLLMGKKTLCADPFSTRFYSFKYKPEYFHTKTDNFQECVEAAKQYDILDECIQANQNFFQQVKAIIESRLTPVTNKWQAYDFATREALLVEKYRETRLEKGDVLVSQLFIDTGNGFTEDCKLIAINNVYGDEIHHVQYDLSAYPNIKALRFDPIESRNCEVEIVSANSSSGNIILTAQAAVKKNVWDRFLTTDPQYFIPSPSSHLNFVEISFRLHTLDLYEMEQTIYHYVWERDHQLHEKAQQVERISTQLNEQDALLHQKTEAINQLNDTLQHRQNQITQQDALLHQQAEQIRLLNDALQHREHQINEQNTRLLEQAKKIQSQSSCIYALYSSFSWKITTPLRFISHCFRKLLKGKQRK